MNRKLLLLGLIIACVNSYGYKGKANNNLFSLQHIRDTGESKAYKSLARTLDEINKRNGKYSNYMQLTKNDDFDNFNLVTVAHIDSTKRFFLGKRNDIEKIEIMSTSEFDEKQNDDFEYKLEGLYTKVADDATVGSSVASYIKDHLNPLKITSRSDFKNLDEEAGEYENRILGKSKQEVLEFFKEKLKTFYPNEEIIIENDKLYVLDGKEQKWEIDYEYLPITKASSIGTGETEEDREFTDSIYTPIFKYKEAKNDNKNGRTFYNLGKDIRVEKKGSVTENTIEFSGVGKVTKLLSMPKEGIKNTININSTNLGTTKYGHNVVFGSDLELKNVHRVTVAKDTTGGSGGQNILATGPTTLSFELDGTKKNEKGHYYKHVLNNTENSSSIIFYQFGQDPDSVYAREESLNDFNIRLMVSSLSEDGTIDMGRKLNYFYKGERSTKNLKLSFISDSFAHALTQRTEDSNSDENNLLDVEIRDKIKTLSTEENKVYKSIATSGKLGFLSETTSSVMKNIDFKHIDNSKSLERDLAFVKALREKTPEEVLELSHLELTEKEKSIIIKDIEKLKSYDAEISAVVDYEINKLKNNTRYREREYTKEKTSYDEFVASLPEKKVDLKDFYVSEDYKNIDFNSIREKFSDLNTSEIKDKFENSRSWDDIPTGDNSKDKIKNLVDKLSANLETTLNKFENLDITKNYKKLKEEYDEAYAVLTGTGWKKNSIGALRDVIEKIEAMEELVKGIPNYENYLDEELVKKEASMKEKEIPYLEALEAEKVDPDNFYVKELYKFGRNYSLYYPRIKEWIYYNLREEQSLDEFKTMLSQLQDTNIYSKMNKVAKNELTTYTNIPFDINRNLSEKKHLARGGYISSRNVQQNFKGNTYTAYGLYEKEFLADTKLGFMVGGSSTNHTLTHNKRTAKTTPATSSSKGISAYLGAYAGKKLYQELNWISGLGFQYGKYDITRNLRNNYQTLTSKGKVDILGLNAYSGLVLDYPLQEDVIVQVKGLLSYSFINQGKVREKEGLNLDINNKNYNYLDSEIGVNFSKTLYDFGVKSNLSAGIYRVMGVYGYKNSNLSAKINGSSHSFAIKGDKVQKDAVKLFIDYNVQKDSGLNYGLDGTYITNSKETDVRFGFKAGYTF